MRRAGLQVMAAAMCCAVVATRAAAGIPTKRAPPRTEDLPPQSPVGNEPKDRRWYGWQILVSDALASATLYSALERKGRYGERDAELYVAVGLYLAGPAYAHFVHGNVGLGFASAGIRVGIPLGLGFTGCLVGGRDCGEAGAAGIVLGIVGAVILDAAVFAYEPRAITEAPPKGISFAPRASVTKEAVSLGLAASF